MYTAGTKVYFMRENQVCYCPIYKVTVDTVFGLLPTITYTLTYGTGPIVVLDEAYVFQTFEDLCKDLKKYMYKFGEPLL